MRPAAGSLAPKTPRAGHQSRPQRDGARRVRHLRIETEPDQNRKGDERAAARDGVHRPCDERGGKHDDAFY